MADYTQSDRPLTVDTPLGKDKLLIRGFNGHEAISQLFRFELDLIAKNVTDVGFDKLLNQKVTVHLQLRDKSLRHFNGVCARVSQGEQDESDQADKFTSYRMELVPELWRFSRKAQSRIFQQKAVPDILKEVLAEISPAFELQGSFLKRDYCVQYRETDFNFVSRLMEEEGIYYFFRHVDGEHKMVVANTPGSHKDVQPGPSEIIYEKVAEGARDEDRIHDWEKFQELRSGKYTLWDHSFELPYQNLEAQKTIQATAKIGTVEHKLKVGGNDKFEIYDFPGEYAQRFDGVDPGGGDRASDVSNIFQDNTRTVEIRMQEEALGSLTIRGGSNCRNFVSGSKFKLKRHFSADGGPYVLTAITHAARGSGDFRAGQTGTFQYHNDFTCIPLELPFRPPRVTPKPVVHGTQTAVVVGPAGEEIFTDKYSRVKVQFHWDRDGKKDQNSSCWIRVATLWAGKQWGMIHIPRIGQEVVLDFLEGDPDQPIIIGSVYNADMMPPGNLPGSKTGSGIKSRSTLNGTPDNFNAIEFDDKKGSEGLWIHAEKDQHIEVENDESHSVGHDRTKNIDHDETTQVKHDRTETVGNNETITISGSRTESVAGNETIAVRQNRTETVSLNESVTIGAARTVTVGAAETDTISGAMTVSVGGAYLLTVGGSLGIVVGSTVTVTTGSTVLELKGSSAKISSPKIELAGTEEVKMGAGASVIAVKPDGVTISGPKIDSTAMGVHTIAGAVIKLN